MDNKVFIETAMNFRKEIYDILEGKQKPWESTGWKEFDEYYKISEGQLNVVSGFPGSGKSEWVDSIMIAQAAKPGTSVCYYSPENWPSEILVQKLMEKRAKKEIKDMTKKEAQELINWVDINFKILSNPDEPISIKQILNSTQKLILEGEPIKHLVIDPWNECSISEGPKMNETDYIGFWLSRCRKFARKYKINVWIVCHPAKPQKDKDGVVQPPSIYDLAGSAHWFNKSDNAFIVHRENKETNGMIVFIHKIKNRYFGKVGKLEFEFIWKGGNFKVIGELRKQELAIKHEMVKKDDPINNWAAKDKKKRLDNVSGLLDNYRKENE